MSPVHRSSSNVDTSNAAIGPGPVPHYSEGEEGLDEDAGIQRSYSMPPAMFDGHHYHAYHSEEGQDEEGRDGAADRRPSRDRERSGICIQRTQGSRRRNCQVLESQSENELTKTIGKEGGSGEGEEEEEEEGKGGGRGVVDMTSSYPRGRRNAFRSGARVARSATCAADGSYGTSAAAARRNAATTERAEALK